MEAKFDVWKYAKSSPGEESKLSLCCNTQDRTEIQLMVKYFR